MTFTIRWAYVRAVAGLLVIATVTWISAGTLAPPAGPVAPTMKPLDQIEPRTPIVSLPYTISNAGSYYLTQNLTTVGAGGGIIIGANDVTIDLNGFAIIGGGSGNMSAIDVPLAQKAIRVHNGAIQNWSGSGIAASNATESVFEKLRLLNNNLGVGTFGAGLDTGAQCLVKDCIATSSPWGIGITVGDGSVVADCITDNNNNYGITTGDNCEVLRCTCIGNSYGGIFALDGCLVESCTTNDTGSGITVYAGSTVQHCVVRGNFEGIHVSASGCLIKDNTCDLNDRGIVVYGSASTIDGNSATANSTYGIYVPGESNIVIRNTARGNGLPYNLNANSVFGRIVNMTAGGQIPDTIGAWANFSY